MDTLDILRKCSAAVTEHLVQVLNGKGIISDEDEPACLSSTMVTGWSEECEEFLRKHGYTGGEINTCSKFFEAHGQIYALYDEDAMTRSQAIAYIEHQASLDPFAGLN